MRLIDADAYAKEMRERQDACEAAMNAEGYEGEIFSLRQHWEGVFAAFVEAKLTLDSMPTVEMPGWISVKDRLPEKDGVYLAFYDGDSVSSVWYERGRKHSEWTDDYEGYCDLEVTHWMPLPEPPKEVSGGD